MRVSTTTIFNQGVTAMQKQQADLLYTQQQVATGRRILTPADDPVSSSQALEASQSLSTMQQFSTNAGAAKDSLALQDSILASVTTLIQNVQTVAVNAGNATLNNTDRASLATQLQGSYQELLALANSTDGNGQYLFSGYQGTTTPFAETTAGTVAYNGDQGQRLMQISPTRQVAVSDSGADVFQRIKTGNGTLTSAVTTGTGSGIISPPTVTNAADPNLLQTITITFTSPTTFDVAGTGTGLPATGVAYTSGNAISYNGWSINITGAPASGDVFTVKPSPNQDLFKTLNDLVNLLQAPVAGSSGGATLTNGLNTAMQNLDNGLNNVLKVRASVGARLNEAESTQSTDGDLVLQHQQRLSSLQDLDYAKAISQLTLQQTALQAAQQSYMKVSGLSLFNYM